MLRTLEFLQTELSGRNDDVEIMILRGIMFREHSVKTENSMIQIDWKRLEINNRDSVTVALDRLILQV